MPSSENMMAESGEPRSYSLVAVDAERYSERDNLGQEELQLLLLNMLEEAAADVGLDRPRWQRQGAGDGELALIPADVSQPRLVDDFVRELDNRLFHVNQPRLPAARLRLRLAIHHGIAKSARLGFAGEDVVLVARLLDARRRRTRDRGKRSTGTLTWT